jgi:hypothetical protein
VVWEGEWWVGTAQEQHEARNAAFRRSLAWHHYRRFPNWAQIEATHQAILTGIHDLVTTAPPALVDQLEALQTELARHWDNISAALERERDANARLLGFNRYDD